MGSNLTLSMRRARSRICRGILALHLNRNSTHLINFSRLVQNHANFGKESRYFSSSQS